MNKKYGLLTVIIIAVVVALVALMLANASKPPVYEIADNTLNIQCSFGVPVPVAEISGLELTDTAPEIKTKTNGADIGSIYKGEFLLKDGAAARLYIDKNSPPFIRFAQGGIIFYINTGTQDDTKTLFNRLSESASK